MWVDKEAARERRDSGHECPAYGTRSVAQATIALLLELTNHAGEHSKGVHEGRWASSRDWSYWDSPLIELDGLTMGIVGLGRIGGAVGEVASALGMKVLACSTKAKPLPDFARATDLERTSKG